MNETLRMQISAYVDGELPQNEAELLLRRLCQDAQLRQQAAEYMALGRALRGERSLADSGLLREKIAAEIDEKPTQEPEADETRSAPRFVRPLAGAAIAATVALAAIVGLQQTAGVDGVDTAQDNVIAAGEPDQYTVPLEADSQLRDMYRQHAATSSQLGANNINARLVTLELREGTVVEIPADADASADPETDGEAVDETDVSGNAPEAATSAD